MSDLVLSSWAFNQYIETPLTNEIPHLSVYDLLNRNLKNDWSKELIGMVKNYYNDFESVKRMHPFLYNESYESAQYLKTAYDHLKYESAAEANVSGFRVPEYLPKLVQYTEVDDTGGKVQLVAQNKINMDISGSYETEMDYLMHEVSRYLSKLYPDHPNSIITLTENERQSYFNEAGHMIHSYFDTYQIQAGNELIDFYLRNKFLTGINPIRAYTGVAIQEKLLTSLLQTKPNDIQVFTGFTSFIAPTGEQSITSNNIKVSDLATSYNLYKFSYSTDTEVEKTTAQKINGKISESLASFETNFSTTETVREFQKNTSSFIILGFEDALDDNGETTENAGQIAYNALIQEINNKIEQYTTSGDLPIDTTIEQIYGVLGTAEIDSLSPKANTNAVYPIFSTSYSMSGEAVVFAEEGADTLNIQTIKSLQNTWLSKKATFDTLKKTPLLQVGNIQYNEQFLLAAGNAIATHAASEYKLSEDFQSIAKMAAKSTDTVFLEAVLSQSGVNTSSIELIIDVQPVPSEEPGIPSTSIVRITGVDSSTLKKNCIITFTLGQDVFTYALNANTIIVANTETVVGYVDTSKTQPVLVFGANLNGTPINDVSTIPFVQTVAYFANSSLIPIDLKGNLLQSFVEAVVQGKTWTYEPLGVVEEFTTPISSYFTISFDKQLTTVLLHPNFLMELEGLAARNLQAFDYRDWEKSLSLDIISKAIAIPDYVTEMSFDVTNDTVVSYKIIYTEKPFSVGDDGWAKNIDDRFQIAKGYDPVTLPVVDFNNRDEIGGTDVSLAAATWTGSNLIHHPNASISDTLKAQNILELPILSFDYIGDLLAKYSSYRIVEYNAGNTDNTDVRLKTEISITEDLSFGGEPISLNSLGKLFFEETLADSILYEILRKDCTFIAGDVVRVKEHIRNALLQLGQAQIMVRDNYGQNHFSFVQDCWEKDEYTYLKLKDVFDIENLPNKKGLLIINNEKSYTIQEDDVITKAKRNVVSKKFYRNGQLVVFDFEWGVLTQNHMNYILNSVESEPPEVYYKNSILSQKTKIPASLSEFENINILNTTPEKYPLIEALIQENKSLYLDSSIKKLLHIPLSYGNLVSNEEYGVLSYTFTDEIPAVIDYYNFDKNGYDKLKDMEDFLSNPSKRPYSLEEIEKFYQRRYIIWGGVVWDANDTSKSVINQRTIWSGYFTNFEIYSTEDVLPEEFIARILSHAQEFSHNILNYNYSNSDGKPTGNYNLALTPTIDSTSTESVEVLQNTLNKSTLKEEINITLTEDLIVEGVKVNINVDVDGVLQHKTFALLVKEILIDNFNLNIQYDSDWFEPVWANEFVVEKSGYTFSSLYNCIFLQDTLGNSKLFDPITEDEEIGLLLEWALYKSLDEEHILEGSENTSAIEGASITMEQLWDVLKSLMPTGFGGNRNIYCIPVLQENGQLFVHCFSFETIDGMHIIKKGTFDAYINALMCDSLLNGYKDIPVMNPLDFSKMGTLAQKFQKYIPTNTYNCSFQNVEIAVQVDDSTTRAAVSSLGMGYQILNYENLETGEKINENVNIDFVAIKDSVEDLGELDFNISDREYSLIFKNRFFKETYDTTVQFSIDESVNTTGGILKCDMDFVGDITFETNNGYALLYDIKAPTKRTAYTTDREILVVDRDYELQNLKIVAIGNDNKTVYLKDNLLDGYNTINQACIDLKPLDATKHTQLVPKSELTLGKCWGKTTDEIGYSFYKKKFITDGTMQPAEGDTINIPLELVDENLPNPVILQDHVGVGDTIEIILHNPPTYRANPNLKYIMSFNASPECKGPYNLIAETNEGNFNNTLIAGLNCLIAVRIVTGDLKDNENAITTLGMYINNDCTDYNILKDITGRSLLFATRWNHQVGFKLHGIDVTTVNIFEDISNIEPYETTVGQIIDSPEISDDVKNSLVQEHPEYNTLGDASTISSVPVGLSAELVSDSYDRIMYVKDGYSFSRNPAEMEIIDATDHLNTAMVENPESVEFVNYESGEYTKLQDYVITMLRALFNAVDESHPYDIAAAYDTIESVKNDSLVSELPTKEVLACILFDNSTTPIQITKDNTYLPIFEYVDIPYLQNTFQLKNKWKKTPVIIGRSPDKISTLGLAGLRTFAQLLENGWFRIRKTDKVQSWSTSPDNKTYVLWDQDDAIISVYNNEGQEQFQTALKLTGYHTDINIYGIDETNKSLPIDIGKNIFIKHEVLGEIIGKAVINNIDENTIYSYFEEGGDCYYPSLNPDMFVTEESVQAYKDYWEYCKKVDNLAPEVCRFPSFRWGVENQILEEYAYSYDAIHKFIDDSTVNTNTIKKARVVIDSIEAMLRGTGSESYFGKGVPFYSQKYVDTIDKNISAYNTRQPSYFHNMIKSSKVLVTNETIQVYGEIEYPGLYNLRETLTEQYTEMYKAIYELDNPDKYNTGIAQWETDQVDSLIQDLVEEVIEEIKTSYSNFFAGNLVEDKEIESTRKNFMIRISLQEEDKGVVYAQPLDESLTIKALTTPDGNNLYAITETGKYNLGLATATALGSYQESDGRVNTQDIELFDAVKNAKCISQDFELINTGIEDVIATTSSWNIITLTDTYTSKISEVGSNFIRLYDSILPSKVDTEQEVTILVSNMVKDNHKGFYYPDDILPSGGVQGESSDERAWNLLETIIPSRTLIEVSSKKYAEFATYENAGSRTINTELGYKKPCVFGDQEFIQIDGTVLNYHMYPIYETIDESLRNQFYEEYEGQLQYEKNMYGRYIYRITDMRGLEGGQPYYENVSAENVAGIENTVEVRLNIQSEIISEPIDESEVPDVIKDSYVEGEPVYINPVDEIVRKLNTLDSTIYYGIKYNKEKVYALKKDGTADIIALQKLPAIKDNASTIAQYQPYNLISQSVEGTLEVQEDYAVLHCDYPIELPSTTDPTIKINKGLTKELVYTGLYNIHTFIEEYLNILINMKDAQTSEIIAAEQLDILNNISAKSTLSDEVQGDFVIQGAITALQDWVRNLESDNNSLKKISIVWSDALLKYEMCKKDDGEVYLSDVVLYCVQLLQDWLDQNTITEDSYYISNLHIRIVHTTNTLPITRPITYFGISNDGDVQTLLTKYNNEIIIPKWGYGQRLIGGYTTPNQCVFADGIFFNEQKHNLENQSGEFVQLVEYNPQTYQYDVIETTVPNLAYESFRKATLALQEDLPLKSSEMDLQMEPVLLDLQHFEKLGNTFSILEKKYLPDFGKNVNTYDIFLTGMKITCKILYSEMGMDATRPVINLSNNLFEKFGEHVLKESIGYTRVFNNSNPIPNGILYRDVNNDFVYTNSIYIADPDRYFAFEDGSLGKINKYGEVDHYGVTDYIHAVSDTDVLNSYKQLSNIFTDFNTVEGQVISLYNIDTFLNINHKFISFGLDNTKFTIEEHEDYKTFLLKKDVNELKSIYLYEYLQKKEGTFNGQLTESKFYPYIGVDASNRVMLSLTYNTLFKTYNMVYLKDKNGNLVAKTYFRNPIDKDTLMVFSKVN